MAKARKYRITIAKHKEYETLYCIHLHPYRYRFAKRGEIDFISQRSFPSPEIAVHAARALFGNVMAFKKDRRGEYQASFTVTADSN
jgi:hypothetical protein